MFAIIDYFFYRVFYVTKRYKDEGDAKWSAFLFTGLYLSLFVLGLLCMIGLIYDNLLSQQLITNPLLFWMGIGIIFPILSGIRYYRFIDIEKIKYRYNSLPKINQTFIDVFILFTLVVVPVFLFVFYRLYVYGFLI